MNRVAKRAMVVSLPDALTCWPICLYIPKVGQKWIHLPRPRWGKRDHLFDGEHYWEINKKGYSLSRVSTEMGRRTSKVLKKTFRVDENPYHRFFVWEG
jgi:hypothetical protein